MRGNQHDQAGLDRRRLLLAAGAMLGAGRASGNSLLAPELQPLRPHFPPKAKAVIHLTMFGGPSQMDLFDYKPELGKRDGQTVRHEQRRGDSKPGTILGTQRKFAQYGETGQWCSSAFPFLSAHMDKLAVIKSLYTDSFAHGSAVLQLNSGQVFQGHPSMGSWIHYALGSQSKDLPGYVVMHDPRGGPISGSANWSSGYMPAIHQGALFRAQGEAVLDLQAPRGTSRDVMSRAMQRESVEFIRALDALHAEQRPGRDDLEARSASYDLAHQMQVSGPEALDLSQEDRRTQSLYGFSAPKADHKFALAPRVFGRQCLIARRLIERGVRYVQIYHGGGHQQQTWDAHNGVDENLSIHCPEVDRPIAGLLTDLEQRGLLDETLVIWGGEFGRQPTSQLAGNGQTPSASGRDHNPKALCTWLAGAGVRPGSYGETDDLGGEAVVDRHHLRDLHATVLHLMGLDHSRLVYPHAGLDRKLTGVVEAHPITGVMA